MDKEVKNFNVIFHTRSAANEFTRKCFKDFTKLHVFTEKRKNFSTRIKILFTKIKKTFSQK